VSISLPFSRRIGILSTFPPTACGIATFSAALAAGLIANGASVDVVRCGPALDFEDPLVMAALGDGTPADLERAIAALDATDVAVIQHEFGIYDGADGAAVLDVLTALTVPTIVVAHTVVRTPTAHQREVFGAICDAADHVLVMTEASRTRLLAGYDVDADRVVVIPHGAVTPAPDLDRPPMVTGAGSRLLTWGLLGPGKGIEWAIDAVASLSDIEPAPRYLVAGATHPKVVAHSGEAYRRMLIERARRSGGSRMVTFDDTYRDLASLTELISAADLVVLPYDSDEQVTSGVLVDAVAAGRPVVATAFPHATELLASGAGITVPQRDPAALAAAIRAVLTDDTLAAGMAAEARRLAPALSWTAVGKQYLELAARLIQTARAARS
jgi:glycosyltransferase involved in cell wall biosynthesis